MDCQNSEASDEIQLLDCQNSEASDEIQLLDFQNQKLQTKHSYHEMQLSSYLIVNAIYYEYIIKFTTPEHIQVGHL
jgi:hypothetical protein